MMFTGSRYKLSGAVLPHMRAWMEHVMGLRVNEMSHPVTEINLDSVPKANVNEEFVQQLREVGMEVSSDPTDRCTAVIFV